MTHEELVANRAIIKADELSRNEIYKSTNEYADIKKFFECSSYVEVISSLKDLNDVNGETIQVNQVEVNGTKSLLEQYEELLAKKSIIVPEDDTFVHEIIDLF